MGRATKILTLLFLLAGLPDVSTPARATLIDVQFASNSPGTGERFSGAALIGSAGDQWGYFLSNSGTNVALQDTSGNATGVSLTYSAQGDYALRSGSPFASTPYAALMNSFLYTTGTTISLTFQGLSAGEPFALIIYGESDGNSPHYGGSVTVNGSTQSALQSTYSTFVDNGNYVEFEGTANINGDITISDAIASGRNQTMVSGIQLELSEIPEPASIALLGSAATGLLAMAYGRRGKRLTSPPYASFRHRPSRDVRRHRFSVSPRNSSPSR